MVNKKKAVVTHDACRPADIAERPGFVAVFAIVGRVV